MPQLPPIQVEVQIITLIHTGMSITNQPGMLGTGVLFVLLLCMLSFFFYNNNNKRTNINLKKLEAHSSFHLLEQALVFVKNAARF